MMEIKKKNQTTIEGYLGQFDFHTHAFSHCVFRQKGLTDAEIEMMSERQKLKMFQSNLEGLCQAAEKKGVKVLGVADHPQLKRYGIKFGDYRATSEEVRTRHPQLVLVNGAELDIKVNSKNELYINIESVGDRETGFEDVAKETDYFIVSLHYKEIKKHTLPKTKKTYLHFMVDAIELTSELRDNVRRFTGKNKVFVIGHPYCLIGETNYKEHDNSEALKQKYATKSAFLQSRDCPIQPFTTKDLNRIVTRMVEEKILMEINGSSIRKGFCDMRKSEPIYKTIADHYIRYCLKHNRIPFMFVNSDAHRPADIANFELDTIKKLIEEDAVRSITVPYERFLK